MLTAIVLSCLVGQVPASPDLLVPDRAWRPQVGDDAVLSVGGSRQVAAATSFLNYIEMVKSINAKDSDGIAIQIVNGEVLYLPSNTPVKILDITSDTTLTNSTYFECRVISGNSRGIKVYVPREWVVRLIPNPDLPKPDPEREKAAIKARERETSKAIDRRLEEVRRLHEAEKAKADQIRASTLLRLGRTMENIGKFEFAIEYYKQIIKEYPRLEQSRAAAERIGVLETPPD